MRASLLLLPFCIILASASIIHFRDDDSFVLNFDLIQTSVNTTFAKRDIIVNEKAFQTYAYLTAVQVGTPGQTIHFQADTGSFYPVVYDIHNVNNFDGYQSNGGFYNPAVSSTAHIYKQNLQLNYGLGYAIGNESVEVFKWGAATLTNMFFLDGTNVSLNYCLLGLRPTDQSTPKDGPGGSYTSIVNALVGEGYIKTQAYSIYLNHVGSPYGSIQFGGLDTTKFTPPLYALPTTSGTSDILVSLTGIYASSSPATNLIEPEDSSFLKNVIFDTGTTYSYLPQDTVNNIISKLSGVYWDDQVGAYIIPCDTTQSLVLSFSGARITLNGSQIALQGLNNGDQRCFVPFFPLGQISPGVPALLGQSFIEAAYIVYDAPQSQIGIAQALPNQQNAQHLVSILPGQGIPGAIPPPGGH